MHECVLTLADLPAKLAGKLVDDLAAVTNTERPFLWCELQRWLEVQASRLQMSVRLVGLSGETLGSAEPRLRPLR
jgi:hypothetical protein